MTDTEPKLSPGRRASATSIRLSPLALRLWDKLADTQGLNRTAYLEMLLRQEAKEKGVTGEDDAASE